MKGIVLVHGSFHGAWCWDQLVPALRELGAEQVSTVELPMTSLTDDIGEAQRAVSELADRTGDDVVLCGHSYGGAVISGVRAGVSRLVYLAGVMSDVGESVLDTTALAPDPSASPTDAIQVDDNGMVMFGPEQATALFFADCPPQLAQDAAARFRPQAVGCLVASRSTASWRELPSTYIVTKADVSLPPELQRLFATRGGSEVVEVEGGHSPFLSQPKVVARILADAARSGSGTI